MCIELLLLAANFNFIAFSRNLGQLDGQIFVFFVLDPWRPPNPPSAWRSWWCCFRDRRTIDVEQLNSLEG